VVQDTLLDERFVDNPLVTGDFGIRFYAGAPLVTPDGNVVGSVCVIDQKPRVMRPEQITALEALARQVMARMELRRQMRERDHTEAAMRTAEKLAAVGRMASSIAHEINNPLQSVTNLLFMMEAAIDAASRSEYLHMAQDELTRVTSIVTQALRFHRQSSAPSAVRLGELAEGVLMLFRTRLSHGGVLVEVRDRQTNEVMCLADDIRQLFSHLLSNALDALSSAQGGGLHIHIRDGHDVRSGAPVAVLTIADSGSGISQQAMERLFQPFNTTKGARGTGLGLWVTKSILEKHRGSVRVRSRIGVGTVVRMVLPVTHSAVSATIAPALAGTV